MSLDTTDTGFESLRGTMLTDAGMDGLQTFTDELPTHLVIDEAFTPECGERIRHVKNLPIEDRSKDSLLVENLVKCLGQVTKQGIEGRRWSHALWQDRSPAMEPHVDFEQGNTVLGFFWVLGRPTFDIFTNEVDEPQDWVGSNPQIHHFVKIGADSPETVAMKSRQMIILNGAAIPATQDNNGVKRTGRASLPHAANVASSRDRRSRLMVFGDNHKQTRRMLPGAE